MIEVTKFNGQNIMVNADHIEIVEANPDTAIVLVNGTRIVVKDTVSEVVNKVIEYQRLVRSGAANQSARFPGTVSKSREASGADKAEKD